MTLDYLKVFKIAETASKAKQRRIFREAMRFVADHEVRNLIVEKVVATLETSTTRSRPMNGFKLMRPVKFDPSRMDLHYIRTLVRRNG